MNAPSDKIMQRIRKMMALANDAGATEAERDNALTHATALLQKHNLTMLELPEEDAHEARENNSFILSCDVWARSLCQAVASLYFCKYYYTRTRTAGKEGHHFVGKQSNAIMAIEMSQYLIRSIRKEASARYRTPTTPEGRSFGVGCTRVLYDRILTMKEQGAQPAETRGSGTEIALANLYEMEKLANEHFLKSQGVRLQSKIGRQSKVVLSAHQEGRLHGKTISLNTQVGGNTSNVKRIG